MIDSESEKCTPILIEFSPRHGVETVALYTRSAEEFEDKSKKALATAMGTIEGMARRVSALHDKIPKEFSQVEVEFGIKFDWEAGVLLAKAGSEATINVTLTWSQPQS